DAQHSARPIAGIQSESHAREASRAVTLVEACVGSLEEALAAEAGGAHRLELCDRLDVGGATPRVAPNRGGKRRARTPVSVMIRPRGGSYVHTEPELEEMRRAVDVAREHGADMFVIGVLDDAKRVDVEHTKELVARARGTPVTFHRAFDEIEDQA